MAKEPWTQTRVIEHCQRWQLSERATRYVVTTAQQEGPSRRVGQNATQNVIVEYQSLKMGHTLHLESKSNEMATALAMDLSPDVVAFFSQPQGVEVTRHLKSGHTRHGIYTPDVLVLNLLTSPSVIEIKGALELEELAAKKPEDWKKAGDGFVYEPAAEAFKAIGLNYKVLSVDQIDWLKGSNLRVLLQLRRNPQVERSEDRSRIVSLLNQHGALSIREIKMQLQLCDATQIFELILLGAIHTDLARWPLVEEDVAIVGTSGEIVTAVADARTKTESLARILTAGEPVRVSSLPPAKQLELGMENLKRLRAGEKSRSARRWRTNIKADGGISTELVCVTPKTFQSGNRTDKLHPTVSEFLANFLSGSIKDCPFDTRIASYDVYRALALEAHPDFRPVTKKTFRKRRHRQTSHTDLARLEGGNRAANAVAPPTDVEKRDVKPARPFELAVCDHYLADLFVIVLLANGLRYALRPWITVLRDVRTKMVLALWISFRSPSRRAVAMVLRRCVSRWNRLPEAILVDRGSDFESVYLSALAAGHSMHILRRPVGHARYGSEAERWFGEVKNLFLSHLVGYTGGIADLRAISANRHPQKIAVLPALKFFEEGQEYVSWSNNRLVDTEIESSQAAFDRLLIQCPYSGNPVTMSQRFLIETAVESRDYTLDREQGIHLRGQHFWTPELRNLSRSDGRPEVREDPEDPYRIYIRTREDWVTARSGKSVAFDQKSAAERLVEAIRVLDTREARNAADDHALTARFSIIGGVSQGLMPPLIIPPESGKQQSSSPNQKALTQSVPEKIEALEVQEW